MSQSVDAAIDQLAKSSIASELAVAVRDQSGDVTAASETKHEAIFSSFAMHS